MASNVNQLVQRTYNIAGSNFQSGVSAGNFFIPGSVNPGVEVGFTHPYFVKPAFNTGTLITVAVGTGITQGTLTVPANTLSQPIEFYPGYFGTQFDYPRCLSFSLSQDVNLTFYSIDIYGNKSIQQVFPTLVSGNYVGQTRQGINILTGISFSTAATGGFTGTVSLTNIFELPYTDMGNIKNLDTIVVSPVSGGAPAPLIVTNNLNAPYTFQMDINYTPASWNVIPTITTCTPRPLVELLHQGTVVDVTTNEYLISQYVYATFTNNSGSVMTKQQALDGTIALGILPFADGWKGMNGNG